jgi:enoyl-CoA hydratase/carnithine racemase
MRLNKPVIAAVEGYAVAGGLELALWCDLRVASDTAVFGVFCRRWGVPLVDGETMRLPRPIGHSRAMALILTGRAVTAAEAERIGMVNRLVSAEQALAAAQQLASAASPKVPAATVLPQPPDNNPPAAQAGPAGHDRPTGQNPPGTCHGRRLGDNRRGGRLKIFSQTA